MSLIAIIETGGKQYLVTPGAKIEVEKLPYEKGAEFIFDKVLLIADGDAVNIGKPYVEGKKISAEIVAQKRLRKVTVFRYHSKTRYRKKKGHRQSVTVLAVALFPASQTLQIKPKSAL